MNPSIKKKGVTRVQAGDAFSILCRVFYPAPNATTNTLPRPASLSARMVPPFFSTKVLTIDSPSPAPLPTLG
jgi:hypothetical protein